MEPVGESPRAWEQGVPSWRPKIMPEGAGLFRKAKANSLGVQVPQGLRRLGSLGYLPLL